jgi:hypothetical protein
METNQITVDISKSIIEHLMSRNNKLDDLSEIALAVYNKEISKLSDRVVDQLTILMHKGIIKRIYQDGKYYYKLERRIEVK